MHLCRAGPGGPLVIHEEAFLRALLAHEMPLQHWFSFDGNVKLESSELSSTYETKVAGWFLPLVLLAHIIPPGESIAALPLRYEALARFFDVIYNSIR